jgi:hypothetical protein
VVCSQAVLRGCMKIIALALCLASLTAVAQTKSKVPASPVKSQGHISGELLRRKTERYSCHCRRHAKVQTATTEKKSHES